MSSPESVEKMRYIVDSLQANPKIVVVGGEERNYLSTTQVPSLSSPMSRTLGILAHPAEPIYDTEELNHFMFGLMPHLEPSRSDRFRLGSGPDGPCLELGKLEFVESIGTALVSAEIKLLSEDVSAVKTGAVGSSIWTANLEVDLKQCTTVSVFPDAGHLADAAEGLNVHSIPVASLGNGSSPRIVEDILYAPILTPSFVAK